MALLGAADVPLLGVRCARWGGRVRGSCSRSEAQGRQAAGGRQELVPAGGDLASLLVSRGKVALGMLLFPALRVPHLPAVVRLNLPPALVQRARGPCVAD